MFTVFTYRVSQGEYARLRESVPYVKVYRYNPKHLCPKLNGYGDNGQRKVWSSCGSTHCTCQLTVLSISVLEFGVILRQFSSSSYLFQGDVQCSLPQRCEWLVGQLYGVAKMPFVFSHVEYCDVHFVYGFCDGIAITKIDMKTRTFVIEHIRQMMMLMGTIMMKMLIIFCKCVIS